MNINLLLSIFYTLHLVLPFKKRGGERELRNRDYDGKDDGAAFRSKSGPKS